MLKAAKIGIAVTEGEGCAVDAIMAADIHVRSAIDGLDLLLNTKRCKAALRFQHLHPRAAKLITVSLHRSFSPHALTFHNKNYSVNLESP